MAEQVEIPGVTRTESTLLVCFIPSVDRDSKPIDQLRWEIAALQLLGTNLGGATAFPKGRGVWRDDQQLGKLIYDETVVVHCYTNLDAIEKSLNEFHQFLVKLGQETNQGAVGFVIDRTYMEIRFPLPSREAANG
jgi:hypothetical protein